ncbi:MAG: MBOAT family protein [Ruminococcaceae bacterium]|nr:MBOAT family protein [Oscillospiraceae bacterium]
MVFSSTVFLFLFLPAVWLLYLLIPSKYITVRNVLLGIASLLFYAYGEPIYIAIMLLSVLFNYCAARSIGTAIAASDDRRRKLLTGFAVVINLIILGFFKYVPWLCSLLPFDVPLPGLSLPVGISFYTFQVLSYVLDVSRGKSAVQKNYFNLLLYISFFPQLIAGPIVAYDDIELQLSERTVTLDGTARGIRRFVQGLSKKLLISNTAAVIADAAFASAEPSFALAWAGALCYSIQIYFDFSGYSDMAIGLASMFGFSICENFNYPYSAVTIRDFWRRWHISLTNWFRTYVYIPLGGNRCSSARTIFNRIFVFFLTGIWHGANFTYILWGLWHGGLMMLERVCGFDRLEKKRAWQLPLRIYTLLCVVLGFVMFRAPSVGAGFSFIGAMFSFGGNPADALGYFSPYTVLMLGAGLLFSAPILPAVRDRMIACGRESVWNGVLSVLCIPLFLLCVMTLASSAFNPFIYYIF